MRQLVLVTAGVLLSILLKAHTYVNSGTDELWHLKSDKQSVKAIFLYAKNDSIFLLKQPGTIIALAITDLTEKDNKRASEKIHWINSINKNWFPANRNNTAVFKEGGDRFFAINKNQSIFIFSAALTLFFFISRYTRKKKLIFFIKGCTASVAMVFIVVFNDACKKTAANISASDTRTVFTTAPKSMDSVFGLFRPAVSTSWDNTYFRISSNGLPSHNMMVGIISWQQQVPLPQAYSGSNAWSIPLSSEFAATPLSTKSNFMKGAIAVAANGIPVFNALNNRGEDSYLIGELDQWGGHCGKADDYHYHVAPLHLAAVTGLLPIAYALDGFPIYGSKEPDGSSMQSLDTCHGHTGTNGLYHYHGTSSYPYTIGAMKGKVTIDPATTAPENQILPQAATQPVRPAGTPLTGAVITGFTANTTGNGYVLEYMINSKKGSVSYSWTGGKYIFIYTDVNGNTTTQTY